MNKHIVTSSGFECDINPAALDDMEIIDKLVEADEGDITALPAVINKIISKDDKKRLYDHVRTEDGRVPTADFMRELTEILNSGEIKK